VEESQVEVEPSDSGTRGRLSTIALGYLIGDREESGIVAPKWYDYEDHVCYVSIVTEEVQNVLKTFREAIESNDDRHGNLQGYGR
jgi:hypothetical protein